MPCYRVLTPALVGGVSLWLLAACSHEAPTRQLTPTAVPIAQSGPTTSVPPPAALRYRFEAERTAMATQCQGPNRSRPAVTLTHRHGMMEWYETVCDGGRVLRLRCDVGACTALP